MALKNTNPTKTCAWAKLTSHFTDIKGIHLKEFFKNNANRKAELSFSFDDLSRRLIPRIESQKKPLD